MDILSVVNQIVMMLLIAAIGLWLRHRKILDVHHIKGINTLVLRVALPMLVLMITQRDFDFDLRGRFLKVLLTSLLMLGLTSIAIFLAVRKRLPGERAPVFAALAALPNAGFMGLPIIQALWGDLGALFLGAYLIGFNMTIFVILERLMAGKAVPLKQVLLNTGFIASVTALLLFVFGLKLPTVFRAVFSQLGGMTTPLSMLLAGARLYEMKREALFDKSLWGAMGLKLLALPLLCYLLFRVLGFTGVELGTMTVATAMPSAAVAQLFAEKYNRDAVYAAAGVSISTILCLASIPLLMWMTGM